MARRIEHACVFAEIDEEGIAWVTLNRPEKRNAMSPQLHYDMEAVMMEIETDEAVKVTVLTGAGESWSAGMDLREYFRETDKDPTAQFRSFSANRRWSWEILSMSRKPTIAMVNGYCFGGAFIPLCACDIVITAEDATFGLSEVNWGILPGGIVSKVIQDFLAQRDAIFYAMTGRTFDGIKAVEMKLANIAVPRENLREETLTVARELMDKNPIVLGFTKQAVKAVRTMDIEQAYEYLRAKSMALRFADTGDTRARGMTEFLDNKTYRPGFQPVGKGS